MRIFMSIRPYLGHLHPAVPLAGAMIRRGHSVLFATAASFCSAVSDAGFDCVPAGLNPNDVLPEEHENVPYARDYGVYTVGVKVADLVALGRAALPDAIGTGSDRRRSRGGR